MVERLLFFWNRLRERLWVKPALLCLFSVAGIFVAKAGDLLDLGAVLPSVTTESVDALLSIMAASMLVIATFAVGSMVSAYASASGSATPRSFSVVVADDVSQNALSAFIGAFIFSIVALVALKNDYFDRSGVFTLFVLTLGVFAAVVLTFVKWVDQIARLGRLGTTIEQVEAAACAALERRRQRPHLGGVAAESAEPAGVPVNAPAVGYVQHVTVARLQECAEALDCRIRVAALPGAFLGPGQALAYVSCEDPPDDLCGRIAAAFVIGDARVFDDDPRFGLIALSEIAARALSPAVNDPGTAIGIIGTYVRLFSRWVEPLGDRQEPVFERVEVPAIALDDMFDDAFTAMARDGAGMVEVGVRLQKAFRVLAAAGSPDMARAAARYSRKALALARRSLPLEAELRLLEALALEAGETRP